MRFPAVWINVFCRYTCLGSSDVFGEFTSVYLSTSATYTNARCQKLPKIEGEMFTLILILKWRLVIAHTVKLRLVVLETFEISTETVPGYVGSFPQSRFVITMIYKIERISCVTLYKLQAGLLCLSVFQQQYHHYHHLSVWMYSSRCSLCDSSYDTCDGEDARTIWEDLSDCLVTFSKGNKMTNEKNVLIKG